MEYFLGDYSEFPQREHVNISDNANNGNNVNFAVDDLLDLSKDDETMTDAFFDSLVGNSDGSSTVTAVDSCNSSVSGGDGQFNGNRSCRSFNDTQLSGNEFCISYDDLAELEWLSNFVEESFSNDDIHFIPTKNAFASDSSSSAVTSQSPSPPIFPADVSIPGKARSKRSRAAPCDWSSRLLHLSPFSSSKTAPSMKREPTETPGRKCLHCGSEKTPQWRSGPMGPKTLCNACGVRFKSGRLVPEYRPAASPSYVSTKHSNSHRKVVELRRQKELQQHQQHQQLMGQASVFNGCDEFPIHRPYNSINGPDFSHMI